MRTGALALAALAACSSAKPKVGDDATSAAPLDLVITNHRATAVKVEQQDSCFPQPIGMSGPDGARLTWRSQSNSCEDVRAGHCRRFGECEPPVPLEIAPGASAHVAWDGMFERASEAKGTADCSGACTERVAAAAGHYTVSVETIDGQRVEAPLDLPASTVELTIAVDHGLQSGAVQLLVTEDELGRALPGGVDGFGTSTNAVMVALSRFDRAHAGALPARLDAYIAFKPPSAIRVWLVGPDGDVAPPAELAQAFGAIPGTPVQELIAVVARFTRDGAAPPGPDDLRFPDTWKPPAGKASATVVDVIASSWP